MLEFTAEDAKELIRAVWAVVWSPTAHRLYVLMIGAGILAQCLRLARRADRWAAGNISKAESEFERRFLGPIPRLEATFEKQQQDIRDRAKPLLRAASLSLCVSFLTGAVIPTIMLYWVTLNYSWLDPHRQHLLNEAGQPFADPTAQQATLFTADQTFRGGLFDLLEIFSWQVTALDNNPANWLFSTGVFGQHLFVEAFIFSGILLYGRSRWQIASYRRRGLAAHKLRYEQNRAERGADDAINVDTPDPTPASDHRPDASAGLPA